MLVRTRVGRVQDDSNIRWMLLKEGELAYDPVTMNYFALNYVSENAIGEAVAEAEKAW
jgi:hypothetical protein